MNGPHPEPTTTLMFQLRHEPERGWPRLLNLYGPVVARWCRLRGLQDADIHNVVQEVFARIHRALPQFDRRNGTFQGWILVITRNCIHDHFRQAKPSPGGSDFLERLHQEPWPEEENAGFSLTLHRAMDLVQSHFEATTWQAFWLTTMEERKAQDVAETLGISVSAVYVAKSKVKARLRQELEAIND